MMLDGAGEGWLTGHGGDDGRSVPIGYGPGYLFLYFGRIRTVGQYEVPAGSRFLTVELRLDLGFMERCGLLGVFERIGRAHPFCRICDDTVWIGRAIAPRAMQRSAQSMIDLEDQGQTDPRLEACALDLLAGAVNLIETPRLPGRKRKPVPDDKLRDAAAIRDIASLMLGNLSRSWALPELAARAALSETRLKLGFRAQYGLPVYAFLQRARMEAARKLLREQPHRSIMEVSLDVGYANPSHFARLFQREFGMRPSQAANGVAGDHLKAADPGIQHQYIA